MNISHQKNRRRGSALVEFALVIGLLLGIILGIIDFAVLGKNNLSIANAAREGARLAAVGRTTTEIRDRVKIFAKPLQLADADITLEYSKRVETTSGTVSTVSYDPYITLDNDTSTAPNTNNAKADDLIRVTAKGRNRSVTGLFAILFNRDLVTAVIMRRERSAK